MIVTIPTKLLTFEEWQQLPETMEKHEIVDGVMLMPPGPNPDHQWVQQEVFAHCREYSRHNTSGVFMHAPLDLVIQRNPLRVRQPDIMFLNAERTGIRGRRELQSISLLEASPDVVIEVLSPGNTRREMESRLADFQSIGVYECWLISPQAETAEIIDLRGDVPRSLVIFGVEDILRSDAIPGFELRLADIFG